MKNRNRMPKAHAICAAILCLLASRQAGLALSSQEVLVVANADSPGSVELARFYARQRGIDESHLVLVKTTTAYAVSREDYDSQIRRPLRQVLQERGLTGRIRCIALMWGIPVRVEAPAVAAGPILTLYTNEAGKSHYRLAIDYKLLATVGRKFPPPRTDGLSPVADLFEQPLPSVSEPLTELRPLLADVGKLLAVKLDEYRATKDLNHAQIMARQLMALHLDIHGLEGLRKFIEEARLADAPDPNDVQCRLEQIKSQLQTTTAESQPTAEFVGAILDSVREAGGLTAVATIAKAYLDQHKPVDAAASVDSELALLWWDDYLLGGWLANPLLWNLRLPDQAKGVKLPPVMMTARIDGPSQADAMRIIRDSVETEKSGLKGVFYIDAGGPERAKEYDDKFRLLYQFLHKATSLPVVFDDTPTTFQPGACPQAALYVGWYSLQQYVPAFTWQPGSVGWHVASFEAMHLRDPNSQEWCVKMIQNGVAATVGAIDEPRLAAFPIPQEFFALLLTGKYSVAECYWRTMPHVSWRMTLIADPLYNPFKANPQVSPEALPVSLLPK
jgi:uncharacterized protein (TIGR03790 family)